MTSSRLRPLREEDAEAVAGLFRAAYGRRRPIDAEEIRTWLRNEALRPEWLRVLEVDGRVVGYGDIWVEEDEVALDLAAPGHWEVFLDWAEEEARRAGVRARAYFPEGHELEAIVAARGYRLWRSSYTMEITLEGRPEEPAFPAGIEVRTYTPDDEDTVRRQLNDAFGDDPFWHEQTPLQFHEFNVVRRGFAPGLWVLAWDGAELAGSALGFSQNGDDETLGWIGLLGVRPHWRRRGLGEALLRASFRRFWDRGLRRAGLGVDTENVTGALRLYERVGMRAVERGDNWVLDL